jgi:hypothetical protein
MGLTWCCRIQMLLVLTFVTSLHWIACVSPVSAQAVMPTCPTGYVLSGAQCIPSAPTPSCPTGYSFSNGTCAPNASASGNSGGSDPDRANSWSIIVSKALGVTSTLDLSGATICFVSGSGGLSVASDYFRRYKIEFMKVGMSSNGEARQAYEAGRCDGYLVESLQAVSTLNILNVPNKHRILPQDITCESCNRTARPIQQVRPSAEPESDGSRGIIKTIQRQLHDARCYTGAIDGDWGSGSEAALKRFVDRACLPSATMRLIEVFHERRIFGSS